jgi:hypothetical protein
MKLRFNAHFSTFECIFKRYVITKISLLDSFNENLFSFANQRDIIWNYISPDRQSFPRSYTTGESFFLKQEYLICY